jgi:hypothetical protein
MLERRSPRATTPTPPAREVASKQTLAEGSPTDADGGDEE